MADAIVEGYTVAQQKLDSQGLIPVGSDTAWLDNLSREARRNLIRELVNRRIKMINSDGADHNISVKGILKGVIIGVVTAVSSALIIKYVAGEGGHKK